MLPKPSVGIVNFDDSDLFRSKASSSKRSRPSSKVLRYLYKLLWIISLIFSISSEENWFSYKYFAYYTNKKIYIVEENSCRLERTQNNDANEQVKIYDAYSFQKRKTSLSGEIHSFDIYQLCKSFIRKNRLTFFFMFLHNLRKQGGPIVRNMQTQNGERMGCDIKVRYFSYSIFWFFKLISDQ